MKRMTFLIYILISLTSCGLSSLKTTPSHQIPLSLRRAGDHFTRNIINKKNVKNAIKLILEREKRDSSAQAQIFAISLLLKYSYSTIDTEQSLEMAKYQVKIVKKMPPLLCDQLIHGEIDLVQLTKVTEQALELKELNRMLELFTNSFLKVADHVNKKRWRKLVTVSKYRAKKGFDGLKEIMSSKEWNKLTLFSKSQGPAHSCHYLLGLFQAMPKVVENNLFESKDLINGHLIFPFPLSNDEL